jgi:RimJ/RimL family protein N-acetyltransferase
MILGEHIRLRAITREDLPLFVEWLNDPEVTHGLMHFLPMSIEDEVDWYEGMRKQPQAERPLMIDILTEEGWEPIGDCGLFGIDWRIRQAEFGIVVGAKQHWDKGYGTEAIKLILQHGFNTLNLNRIALRVYENNPRAIRSYEKAGLQTEGRLRQGHFDNGEYVDVILMSILREEWEMIEDSEDDDSQVPSD